MKIKNGCVGFHVAFVVPNSDTERMESFLKTHEEFMRETHHIDGDVEPVILCYAVLKSPELNDKLKQKIINGTALQSKNLSIDKLSNIRDNFLIDLIELKKKYRL